MYRIWGKQARLNLTQNTESPSQKCVFVCGRDGMKKAFDRDSVVVTDEGIIGTVGSEWQRDSECEASSRRWRRYVVILFELRSRFISSLRKANWVLDGILDPSYTLI